MISNYDERRDPLFNKTKNYVPRHILFSNDNENDVKRIIQLDAMRTFINDENINLLITTLEELAAEFDSYSQSMSFVCGLLLLNETKNDTKIIMHRLNKILKNYWLSESIGSMIDAYAFEVILKKIYPDIYFHFKKIGIIPELYCIKWFQPIGGQTINLNFSLKLIERILIDKNISSLIELGLNIIKVFYDDILENKNIVKILKMLNLDEKIYQIRFYAYDNFDIIITNNEIKDARKEVKYKIKMRIQDANEYFENITDED